MRLRRRRHPGAKGMPPVLAGAIAVVIIGFAVFVAFTKFNPFSHPYKLVGTFRTVNNLKPNSPVRIAGVEVGKVKKVQAIDGGNGAGRVTMELKKTALPIKQDATMKIRPRIFLEGNFFVDVSPGSPTAPTLKSGGTIPASQTAAPVQLGDVLASLQSDTRGDLQTLLKEYSSSLKDGGAEGFNQALRNGGPAFRSTAIVSDALLGEDPTKDLQRVLRGQAATFRALDQDENALKGLVTNANTTFGALASQDVALEASIPALRDVLRVGSPALASVNNTLPTLRVFAKEALPGVRSATPTLKAALPFIAQARALVRPSELQGTARELRRQVPALTGLNAALIPVLASARQLSSCTTNVLVPLANKPVPNPDEPSNDGQIPRRSLNRGFVGLAGESRLTDGNQSWFRTTGALPPLNVRPAAPSDGGNQPPPHRPDIPCETQEVPNLNAPGGSITQFPTGGQGASTQAAARIRQGYNKQDIIKAARQTQDWLKSGPVEKRKAEYRAADRKAAKDAGDEK